MPRAVQDIVGEVKIIWVGNTKPNPEALSSFLTVRKPVVLRAFQWLKKNNHLFDGIEINQQRIDEFARHEYGIHPSFLDNITLVPDQAAEEAERTGYVPALHHFPPVLPSPAEIAASRDAEGLDDPDLSNFIDDNDSAAASRTGVDEDDEEGDAGKADPYFAYVIGRLIRRFR